MSQASSTLLGKPTHSILNKPFQFSPELVNHPFQSSPAIVNQPFESSPAIVNEISQSSPAIVNQLSQSSPVLVNHLFQSSPTLVNQPFQSSPALVEKPFLSSPESVKQPFQSSPELVNHPLQSSPIIVNHPFQSSPALVNQPFQSSAVLIHQPFQSSPAKVNQQILTKASHIIIKRPIPAVPKNPLSAISKQNFPKILNKRVIVKVRKPLPVTKNRSPAILPVLTTIAKPEISKRRKKLPVLPQNLNESSILPVFEAKKPISDEKRFQGQQFTAVPPNVHLHNQLKKQYSDGKLITTIDKLLETIGTCLPVGVFRKVPGMKDWCNENCNHVPRNCPITHCQCIQS